jgi:hypothetical protein
MALKHIIIDPTATALTPDQVIAKINAAEDNITRVGSVDSAARPIEDAEVTADKLAKTAAKDNLDALADTERGYVRTNPAPGEFPIIAVQRDEEGKLDVLYDDVPVPEP